MKKRIVALILVVVMSLLALSSCGSFNFAKEDLSAYATFDYADFKAALAKIEIEDGEFTTNEEIREKLTQAKVYNAVVDKIISATKEEERITEGEIGGGDVLYFVYYATLTKVVDEQEVTYTFFGSDMNTSSITASSTKANHVVKLGDHLDPEDDEFLYLVRENLAKAPITDYIYSVKSNSELQDAAVEALKAEKPEATVEEIEAAKKDAIKVKDGDVLYISYTVTYKQTDADGVETEVKESAAYEKITVDASNPLHQKFLEDGAVANYGATFEAFESKDDEGKVTTNKTFEVDGRTYSNLKFLWKVEKEVAPYATFKYTPYTSEKKVAPDNLVSASAEKIDLKDQELTYYVFPVYAIHAPLYSDITAEQLLFHIYGSKLSTTSLEILGEEGYKNGDQTVEDIIKEIAKIFDTKSSIEGNTYYKDGGALKELNDAYNKAVEDGGSKPTAEQQTAIDDAKEALTDKQNELLKAEIAKIVAATNGTDTIGDKVIEEYYDNDYHSLKHAYDEDITKKIHQAVWDLIDEKVKLTGSYPEKLLEEYIDHLYEHYEYEFYKGNYSTSSSSNVSNYDQYNGSFEAYLKATLKLTDMNGLDAALEKEAKSYIDPIIKIYVVSKACEADALKAMTGENSYIELDIKQGLYRVDEESIRETYKDYPDKIEDKIKEANENAEENIEAAREEAKTFVIDDAFMKNYKKDIGSAYYRDLINDYGEINLRAGFQFNKLFYYLTCTDIHYSEEEKHIEAQYVTREDGNTYLSFRTITYTIKVETPETEEEAD